jgi:hypothetical protein
MKNRKNSAWFFAAFLLPFLLFSHTALGDMNSLLSSELDYGLLSGVCGPYPNGVDEAAFYVGEGPHPVVLIDKQEADKHEWNDNLTSAWQPESISTTQLVGCVEEENELIETCPYTGGHFVKRYRRHLIIDLHEVHNGKKIGTHEFLGGVPDSCHLTETFFEYQLVKVKYGSHVTFEEAETWLTDYVNASIPAVNAMPWIPLLLFDENNELPQPNSCGEGLPLILSILSFPMTVTAGSSYDGSVTFQGGFEDIANPRVFSMISYLGGSFQIFRSTSAPTVRNCSMDFSIHIPDDLIGTGKIYFKLIDYDDSINILLNWSNNAVSNEISQNITVQK